MEQIVETGERIILHTSMTNQEFAKANMMQHIKAEGYIAEETSDGSIEFQTWFFEDTSLQNDKFMLLGPAFFGKTVYQILKEVEESCKNTEICTKPNNTQIAAWEKIFRVIKAMRSAEEKNIILPNCGAIGIVCAEDKKILFLPELLVARSVSMRSQKEAVEYVENWRQPILPIEQISSYSAAVMIYTIITGKRPLTAETPEQLTENFLDSFFIPAEYLCTISKENAEILTNALKGKIKFRPTLKRLLSIFGKDLSAIYMEETKTANPEIKEKFYSNQVKQIKKIRFFKKHFTQISVSCIAVVLIAIVTIYMVNTELERPTTKGLTSLQVVESFYSAFNHLDTIALDECFSKKSGKQIKNAIATIYVTGKMQSVYNRGHGFLTPAQWIVNASPESSVYGITHLKINGNTTIASADWFKNNQKNPLEIENGKTEHFDIEYYLIFTEQPEIISISTYKDSLELTFIKNKWLITTLDRSSTTENCNKSKFFEDLANNNTESYKWFPSEEELKIGEAELNAQVIVF